MSDPIVNCARCGKAIPQSEAQMAQPLITLGELLKTGLKTPALLSGALPDVPFCSDCRPIIAKQRTNEQLKFLGLVLAVLMVLALLIWVIL